MNHWQAPLLFLSSAVLGAFSTIALARARHSSDVQIVFYFFCLALTVTGLLAWWAIDEGFLDAAGVFRGPQGAVLNKLLAFMVNVNADIKLVLALAAVVVVPQWLTYVLSGLFGCASTPLFVRPVYRFVVWSIVKCMVVVAGIFLALCTAGLVMDWPQKPEASFVDLGIAACFALASGFWILAVYRDAVFSMHVHPEDGPGFLRRAVATVHKRASRHVDATTP